MSQNCPRPTRLSVRRNFPNHGKTHANDSNLLNGTHLVIVNLLLVNNRGRDGELENRLLVEVKVTGFEFSTNDIQTIAINLESFYTNNIVEDRANFVPMA